MKKIYLWIRSIFEFTQADYQSLIDSKNRLEKQKDRLEKIKNAAEMLKKSNAQQDPVLRKIYYNEGQRLKSEFDLMEKR